MADEQRSNSAALADWRMTRREAMAVAAGSAGMLWASEPGEAAPGQPGENPRRYDMVVVGGGPAGLSAALVGGRACRRVLLCDAGSGRNAPAAGVHGFLGQDGTPPATLRQIALEQLTPYDVAVHHGTVTNAQVVEGGFAVTLDDGALINCRKLIMATGMVDLLPEIPGVRELWGQCIIHCPYCHGWEFRDQPWAALVPPEAMIEVATLLLGWTKQLTLLTNGPTEVNAEQRGWLDRHGVKVVTDAINRVEGTGAQLTAIHCATGRVLNPAVLFLRVKTRQRSEIPVRLGCQLVTEGPTTGTVQTKTDGSTEVPGLWVVGDASSVGVPSVASAAAEGGFAAAVANMAMLTEDARRAESASGGSRRG